MWLVAALLAALWLGALNLRALYAPDEGRYAQIPQAMVASGDWVTPRLNDLKYFEKPPLQYWATAMAFTAFGEHDWSARLAPALFGLIGALLVGWAARRTGGDASGRYAGLLLASTLGYVLAGEYLTLDMTLSLEGEALVSRQPVEVRLGSRNVPLPPGAFVQAVGEAESEMIRLVVAAVGKARPVADLFAGLGTFALALAERAEVTAVESDGPALKALAVAAARGGLKPITPLRRDLFREPLSPRELDRFGAVVLDPPRAGAKAQAEALAGSSVPVVVAVSCNPATLARDVRTLLDGGYALARVTPIDQFLFAPHVEVVAELRRNA